MQNQNLSPMKVLYVEDEVLIAMDGQEMLRAVGFEDITLAMSLAQAKKVIVNKTFDVALLDINLGAGQTSLGLVNELRARQTRILFASGYTDCEEFSRQHGCLAIQKPFDEATLRAAVFKVLGQ